MLNFGVLGEGKFGSVYKAKLSNFGTVKWSINSNADFRTQKLVEWVFIVTPNELHYEQAKFFLNKGINVFLEKPPVLNHQALKKLISFSNRTKAKLYISDIFLYQNDFNIHTNLSKTNFFSWIKKTSKNSSCLLDRLAYHHLYLIYEALKSKKLPNKIEKKKGNKRDHIEFKMHIDKVSFEMKYMLLSNCEEIHVAFGIKLEKQVAYYDPMFKMIYAVLNEEVDYDANHARATWVLKILSKLKNILYPRVDIIGAGVFGISCASELAKRGFNVSVFEKKNQIMTEASAINQYRVHRGYHYPRSDETALECLNSSKNFVKNFRSALLPDKVEHYYAISSQKSLTTRNKYIEFLNRIKLEYEVVDNLPNTSLTVRVKEYLYDPKKLKSILKDRLLSLGIKTYLGRPIYKNNLSDENISIAATYSSINDWSERPTPIQFELCEKPVLKLPCGFKNKSVVIMDGPFMCIDPFGDTGYHLMGNVVHAIHTSNIGFKPEVPKAYKELINKGIVNNPKISKINKFLSSAKTYFPGIENSTYIGSMFTVRAVIPNREHDDARPTIINWENSCLATIFSGKICTCLNTAIEISADIDTKLTHFS